ncbi:glutathione S-transferase N-terminal domain-containing protein [Corallococcus interemptor]|uniref:glutathione S-transferase N-terminal domain-containing protein n=1 Tax=Corallococcus interemptor TaxID=2316720 RepID=UPI003CFBC786
MAVLEKPVIIGRSSSHFTRIARIFAAELRAEPSFQVVRDLLSTDPGDYGGNPALRIPVLKTSRGVWFGALNASREMWRQSSPRLRVVWPEDLDTPLLANMQELTLQAMATEVTLVMEKMAGAGEGTTHARKLRESLLNMMAWLEQNANAALAALPPERDVSYLEVTLFCLVTHLEFRDVLPVQPYAALNQFRQQFEQRPSANETRYRFDT